MVLPELRSPALAMDEFLNNIERERPIRFTSEQLKHATGNYSHRLGAGGFGEVYKGALGDGVLIAVKVLRGTSNKRVEEQFMAEVSTIGRTHHHNLVRLHGFCFECDLRALVYEYMENGSLDCLLFHSNAVVGWEMLREIAIGTAKGIAYLHEECHQRIVHYDIKPGNILLNAKFCPKVSDFGLAKLCSRENSHLTLTGGRGTPGYAAPELWMPSWHVTHKCDVYSFGMLLFEVLGRRRNLDVSFPESQEWFPKWVWKRMGKSELGRVMEACGIEEGHWEAAERMARVALWCVQYQPEARPEMSAVVRMLEGGVEIPEPTYPFNYLVVGTPVRDPAADGVVGSDGVCFSPLMRKLEISVASS